MDQQITTLAGTPAWGARWQQWAGALCEGPPSEQTACRMSEFAAAWWAYLLATLGGVAAQQEIARCVTDVSGFLAWAA